MRLPTIGAAASLLIVLTVIPSSSGHVEEMVKIPPGPRWPVEIAEPIEEELNETSKMIEGSPICFPNHQNPIICFEPVCPNSCEAGSPFCFGQSGLGLGIGFYDPWGKWTSAGVQTCD